MLAPQVRTPPFSIFTLHFWHPFLFCKFNCYVPPCHCEYLSPRTLLVSDNLIAWSAIINSSSCFPHPFSRFDFFGWLFYAINSVLCPTAPLCCPPQAEAVTRGTGKNSPFSFFALHCFGYFLFFNTIVTSLSRLLWITQSTDTTCRCWHNDSSTTNSRSSDCRCRVRNLLLPHFYISVLQWSFFTLTIMPPSAALKKPQPTFTIRMCWLECLVHRDKQK